MLDINFIRKDPERTREGMRAKGHDDPGLVDHLLDVDRQRRALVTDLQEVRARSNDLSSRIGPLMQAGKQDEAQQLIDEAAQLKNRVKALEEKTDAIEVEQQNLLLEIPNVPHPSVPVGRTPSDNEVLEEAGEKPSFPFEAAPHWTLSEQHELVDFERGAKVTGTGFPFYVGNGARLQRALLNFFLDRAAAGGYTEVQPPLFVNADSAHGTGQLPDKEDLMYEIPRDGLFPIPTAEVPVTNFLRGEILDAADLPLKYCAYTPCFRREAGSYGSEVRGLNRLHQFDKVELVWFTRPETSYDALEALREDAEALLKTLGLPYRRLLMCTGDMGFTQAKKYDLEVWSAGQERWLEVSSISNFEAYQARRAGIRFRPEEGSGTRFVHTLNGSALAFPRVVAALLETYQQEDGTIEIPEVLRPYTGFERIG